VRGTTADAAMEERAMIPSGPDWTALVIAVVVQAMLTPLSDVLLLVNVSSPPRTLRILEPMGEVIIGLRLEIVMVLGVTNADAIIPKEFA